MISNCGHDENGKYTGGKPGDQTGKEWELVEFYDYPWTHVISAPTPAIARITALLAIECAMNDKIGYSQGDRYSFVNELKEAGWMPIMVGKECNADCSSGVAAILICAGMLLDDPLLKDIPSNLTTRTIRKALYTAGFTVESWKKEMRKTVSCGDILLAEGNHVAVNIGDVALITSTDTVGISQEVKPVPAQSKEKIYNRTWCVVNGFPLTTKPGSGNVIKMVSAGDIVRCYGYYTDSYLYVKCLDGGEVGYIHKSILI